MMENKSSPKNISVDGVCLRVCYGTEYKDNQEYAMLHDFMSSIKHKHFPGHITPAKGRPFTRVTARLDAQNKLIILYGYASGRHWGWYRFNPAKLSAEGWGMLNVYLGLLFFGGSNDLFKKAVVWRCDIAFDYPDRPFENYLFIDRYLRKGRGEMIPKGTAYLGGDGSTRGFCCYDKRRELLEKKGIVLPNELLRIELRLRRRTDLHLQDVVGMKNPLAPLAVIDWDKLLDSDHPTCRTLAKQVAAGEPPDYAFHRGTSYQKAHAWHVLQEVGATWWNPDLAWTEAKAAMGWHEYLH